MDNSGFAVQTRGSPAVPRWTIRGLLCKHRGASQPLNQRTSLNNCDPGELRAILGFGIKPCSTLMNRVLVFFGEETQSEELTLMLRQAGVRATVAPSADSMVAALADPYDAIFSELQRFLEIPALAASRAQRVALAESGTADQVEDALGRDVDDCLFLPIRNEELRLVLRRPRAVRASRASQPTIIGTATGLAEAWRVAEKAAGFDADILLTGESGTGKELFAMTIHERSPRKNGAFVPVNCAAIPQGLAESLLFGHVEGAFTGAHATTQGVFVRAHGGTLFLDEVGDFSAEIQVKLLRALQSGEVQPLGATATEAADVRVIAATSRDLPAMIAAGTFREDLYYRLAVVPIPLPALRSRPEDIGPLVDYFLERFAAHHQVGPITLCEEAKQLLLEASWPGNVRQLQNAVERLVVLCEGGQIDTELVRREIRSLGDASGESAVPGRHAGLGKRSLKEALRSVEAEFIRESLAECGGKRGQCAKRLSISPRSLLYKLKEFGIP